MGANAPRVQLVRDPKPLPEEKSAPPDEESNDNVTTVARAPPRARRALGGGTDQVSPAGGSTANSTDEPDESVPSRRRRRRDTRRYRLPVLPEPSLLEAHFKRRTCTVHTCNSDEFNSKCRSGDFHVKYHFQKHIGKYWNTHKRCHVDCPGYPYLGAAAWAAIH
ncbi:hypothetical protein PENSPDRAFT_656474 [Peniophora sp. CONT]|nr:hypothetical protein PENSPDRAFT_656474 [Peniophora sp. CONT]